MSEEKGRLYKYLPADLLDVVFTKDNEVTLKFTKPNEFNDPYELFLAADFGGDPEMLACYAEAIGELPQYPTTCFSRSPIVMPMWAHYAYNHNGFVIEFSEDHLVDSFPDARLDNVSYKDGPVHDFQDLVARVLQIGKPRYTYFLRGAVFSSAYFSKASCWAYEEERRMVVGEQDVRLSGNLMLMNIPGTCVSGIVCGARATRETKAALKEVAQIFSAEFYELCIGKNSAVPYLLSMKGETHSFNGFEIMPSNNHCASCFEPIGMSGEECAWCQITDDMKWSAAVKNPYRIIDSYGGLDKYISEMNAVGGASRRKRRGKNPRAD